jgi:folate-binding protein YgfZ
MIQDSTTISTDAYRSAREHAAFLERQDRGLVEVSGPDRASFLQGLLTNDVASLAAGEGCYAAYLTPQGRMITDVFVYELGELMLLTIARETKDAVIAKLDQNVFTEDVKFTDITEKFAHVSIVGPRAASSLAGTGVYVTRPVQDREPAIEPSHSLDHLPEHGNVRTRVAGQPAVVTRAGDLGEPGFDVYVDRQLVERFKADLAAAGVAKLDAGTADVVRIEAGIQRFGRDMDEETIPLEAGIESRAISFTKGCYVGQEVIVRVLHRGHGRVARKLVGLAIEGQSPPAPGALVRADDRQVGHITSTAYSPRLARSIALAYVQRDFVTPGTTLSVDGVPGVVSSLPFARQ